MAFIGISVMIIDVHLLWYQLSKHVFWKNVCLGPLPIFNLDNLFIYLSSMRPSYVLDINSLLGIQFIDIFSHPIGCLFVDYFSCYLEAF